ncbi:type VI secretion system tip protein VgrG, partial [Pseudomonas sp. 10B1]|nr:type VI secretion system tip protein VgrG [Pseudomonas sp. RTI1]MEB0127902.1 type VI secretion system tip protein VgrG [Pseudomonas sp. CCC1.2]MEB0154282.1 type VI secretion system tip protein VgrG [Pseudomonas sp. CCC4.3]MEB0181635.1 type VI secretion system tip protein VgrG [Pseudomonas sp. CCC3.2]MEB0222170.1 type VI secretion system tip protein VgrG [Pseudomonas sp. AB12(2023)]MEB0310935.1 type VI secretion system tip protein VgrG [Pseudomonas sp. 10B1]
FEDRDGAELVYLRAQRDMEQLVQNDSRLEVRGQRLETIKGGSVSVMEAEHHQTVSGDRKVQLSAGDHLHVTGASHTRVTEGLSVEAGQEVHLMAGVNLIIDAGTTLTLEAGGQHLFLSPAGIFSSVPILLGGVPLPGTPAVPLPPEGVDALGADVIPPVTPISAPAIEQLLEQAPPHCEVCEMEEDKAP